MRQSKDFTRIDTPADLLKVFRDLELRPSWHEPDEQEVQASVHGSEFDNAGFWATGDRMQDTELHVILHKGTERVAAVNLATLFAWATEYAQILNDAELTHEEYRRPEF